MGKGDSALASLAASGACICFINSNKAWGGGENWHFNAACYFAKQGCRVVLCGRIDGALYKAGKDFLAGNPEFSAHLKVEPWHFANLDFLNISKLRKFSAFIRQYEISHVIAGQTVDMKAVLMASRALYTKVYYRRGLAFPVKNNWINRKAYASLTGLIVNSKATAKGVLENIQTIPPKNVHVVYNGLDINKFDSALQASSGIRNPKAGFVIGNAGRLTKQKGQKYLLFMSAHLKREGFKHKVVIAGEGELREELSALAGNLGLTLGSTLGAEADVILLGFQSNLAPFWNSIDFFVLSSLWEGFGYVLAEAMLAKKPLCAFNVNSMPELVQDGVNGFLLPPPAQDESDEQVAARLAQLIITCGQDKKMLDKMGENGRKICQERFNETLIMDEIATLLMQE